MKLLKSLLLTAALSFLAPSAFAGTYTGGIGGNVSTGVELTTGASNTNYSSEVKGFVSSSTGGGGLASSEVNGTGASYQAQTGYGQTGAFANGQLGQNYAIVNTGGYNTVSNNSVGTNYGSSVGNAEGQVGGDYSASASGKFSSNHNSTESTQYANLDAYLGLGGYVFSGYAPYTP